MDDICYLEHYIMSLQIMFDSKKDYIFVKDNEFKYQMMTEVILEMVGLTAMEVIGYTAVEISHNLDINSTAADLFMRQDQHIRNSGRRGTYLEIFHYNDIPQIAVVYKVPIINPTTQKFIGIRGQIMHLIWPNVIKTLFSIHGLKHLDSVENDSYSLLKRYPLSNIQHMVLYLCLHKYSYSEIALFLSSFGHKIAPLRVNDYLEQLKLIFHVRTKTQLVEKAINLNFHTLLPASLFNKFASFEIGREVASIICCNCRLGVCSEHITDENQNAKIS